MSEGRGAGCQRDREGGVGGWGGRNGGRHGVNRRRGGNTTEGRVRKTGKHGEEQGGDRGTGQMTRRQGKIINHRKQDKQGDRKHDK